MPPPSLQPPLPSYPHPRVKMALAAAAAFKWHTVLEYIGVLGTLFLTWRYFAFGTSTEMQRDFEKVQGAAGAVAGVASGVLGAAAAAHRGRVRRGEARRVARRHFSRYSTPCARGGHPSRA